MADTNKKEYTSNLHPKGDLDTTVYPNVKSENIIDKDTTAYTAGKVPDSSLVSKSLDGLNEKIETNKIQTDTNKTNIATLQGDVSTLKQDNQTTKTTIAGLVSADTTNKANIAKNTQDIENLSKVTPTDINVDSNFNLILEHDGKEITGQKKLIRTNWKNYTKGNFDFLDSITKSKGVIQKGSISIHHEGFLNSTARAQTIIDIFEASQTGDQQNWCGGRFKYDPSREEFSVGISWNRLSAFTYLLFSKGNQSNTYYIQVPNKSGTMALKEDLATKQSTLYRHTVLISEPNNKTAYLTFTAESEKNTPIDSIQDLISVFGHTSIACSGIYRDSDPANSQSLLMINVGTSISDTTISSATIENNAITDFSNALFTDTFGSTGFTITDNVTAM